jgi:excinuclease ABC subunit C
MSFDYKQFLENVSKEAGVYQMFDEKDNIIYIGKAKNLKNRLTTYFKVRHTNKKTIALISQIYKIEVIITNNEVEALILEANLIKVNLPKYNVLLRDDKTFSYIFVSDHKHPRIAYHRGTKKKKGNYYGPYPSAPAVKESINILQKVFPVRQCEDGVYNNRSRPCLMHQIGKCSAPCVSGHISDKDYLEQVKYTELLLEGKNQDIQKEFINKMQEASDELRFEDAGLYRDKIKALNEISNKQSVSINKENSIDAISIKYSLGVSVINITYVRNGNVIGNKSYFPKIPKNVDLVEIFYTFLTQYYLNNSKIEIPEFILLDDKPEFIDVLRQAILKVHEKKTNIQMSPKKENLKFLEMSRKNAENSLMSKLKDKTTLNQRFTELEKVLDIEINRMECFDISHHQGDATIGSCVVFNKNGALRQDYRKYNIEGITGGDDYAGMEQALTKRYKNQKNDEKCPDVIFIDGGKGQVGVAKKVLSEYTNKWDKKPIIIGISKGVTRKHGDEVLMYENLEILSLPKESPALHLIWQIRDESHNHAIAGSRAKFSKQKIKSSLEEISGIGAKKRKALINYFGGLQNVKSASIQELKRVDGINESIAETIYHYFR